MDRVKVFKFWKGHIKFVYICLILDLISSNISLKITFNSFKKSFEVVSSIFLKVCLRFRKFKVTFLFSSSWVLELRILFVFRCNASALNNRTTINANNKMFDLLLITQIYLFTSIKLWVFNSYNLRNLLDNSMINYLSI